MKIKVGNFIYWSIVAIILVWSLVALIFGDGCQCRLQISDAECERAGGQVRHRWDTGRTCVFEADAP